MPNSASIANDSIKTMFCGNIIIPDSYCAIIPIAYLKTVTRLLRPANI